RVLEHVTERRDTQIRETERGVGDARAGEIERLEPGLLGEQRAVRIDGARNLERPLLPDERAKSLAGAHERGIHNAMKSSTGSVSNRSWSAHAAAIAALCLASNSVARLRSNFVTSCGMPSVRRRRC